MEPALLVVVEYIDEEPDVVALIGGSGRAGERGAHDDRHARDTSGILIFFGSIFRL